jgi:hypothetical protein
MTEVNSISAIRGHAQALKFVAVGGAELSDMLASIATRKEGERRGPIEVALFLVTHFVDDEGVHSIPVPGSKKETAGNNPYDKYSTTVKTSDGTKQVPGSWYTDVVKNTAEAKAIYERLDLCGGGEGSPKDINDMSPGERAMEKKRLGDRIRDMRAALVRGAGLFLHADEISALNPTAIKVKMPWKTVDGKRNIYANTIRLQDPTGEFEDEIFTVSEFLRLDLSKLVGPGSAQTIKTVAATKARAPKTDKAKGKGKNDIVVPTTVEGLLNLFNIAGTSIDTNTEQGNKLSAALMAACSGKNGDDVVETIGDFALAIDAIWTTIDKRYNAIKQAKAAKLNVKTAA